jgi:signal transduction histidine kinase
MHSGVHEAELILGSADGMATAMVIDAGVGFDPERIAPDRLGLRSSVITRVQSAGGSVKIFAAPGEGASVLIAVPLVQPEAAP